MLLNDVINIIKRIEHECDKEISVLRFGELNPSNIQELVFVPEYCYCDNGDGSETKVGGTD